MKTTLSESALLATVAHLKKANAAFATAYPGESGGRQPVHCFYGGAHLFQAAAARRLGDLALRSLEEYAPDPKAFASALGLTVTESFAEKIYCRVIEKLRREPVEDLHIDFEDGYGNRPDEVEDGHAVSTAREVAGGMKAGSLPPFIGIRIKPLNDELMNRSLRTLDLFLTTLLAETGGTLPGQFLITLPKLTICEQAAALAETLDTFEKTAGLPHGILRFEIMIETAQSIVNAHGETNLPRLLGASNGRCVAAHFGIYDYTASCGITAAHQHMLHPACDFARSMMQVAFAGTGVHLSDGGTNIMPVPVHRGSELTEAQVSENQSAVHRAWKLHFDHIQHSLANGFYQGWDLHPAQLPTRYAAVYAFYLQSLDEAAVRLKNFIEKAAQATLVGDVFDDAATGQGLLNFFVRAINCGAIDEAEAQRRTAVTHDEFVAASFPRILKNRTASA
jgi:citrate lyase beta subunit